MSSPRPSHALRVISPPIPAGSPIVTTSGSIAGDSNSDVDKRGTPQIAQVAAREVFRALARQLVGDLLTRRQGRVRHRLLANHDHPDPILLDNRLRGLSCLQLCHNVAYRWSDLAGPETAFARKLRRPLLLADLQHLFAILSGSLGVRCFTQSSTPHPFARLRRQ